MSDASAPDVAYGPKEGTGKTRAMVKRLFLEGKKTRDIATLTGLSTQGVNYHIQRLRASGELPSNGKEPE